jgi:hypothetical protein
MLCAEDVVDTAWPPNASVVVDAEPEVWRPVPFKETVFVPTPVGMLNEPDAAPIEDGVKAMLNVQVALAASDAPQVVLETLKGAAMLAAEIVALVLPEFVRVTACALDVVLIVWVPNARLDGDVASTASRPVPLSATVFTPPFVSIVNVPACAPIEVGANETLTVQLLPTATDKPQLCVAEYWPFTETPLTVRAVLPVLLSVTPCAVETVLTA